MNEVKEVNETHNSTDCLKELARQIMLCYNAHEDTFDVAQYNATVDKFITDGDEHEPNVQYMTLDMPHYYKKTIAQCATAVCSEGYVMPVTIMLRDDEFNTMQYAAKILHKNVTLKLSGITVHD